MSSDLFKPVQMGPLTLANRIVMAPLTRSRAGAGEVPSKLAPTYYTQRATAGLIISEATQITRQGQGYAWTPGIETHDQVAGWKHVTEAVHAAGGRIFAQLWHVGRISHRSLQEDGALPVAPSAIRPEGQAFTATGLQPFVTPRALETREIPGIVRDYANAARNARDAGFDGVEIHAANGYLIDQFLRDKTNQRSDQYGGTIEHRTRFLREVTEAVVGVWGADRVGIRFSPVSPVNDIADSHPRALFLAATKIVDEIGLVYMHVVEGATGGPRETTKGFDFVEMRQAFRGLYIANNSYDLALAETGRREKRADLIAFGRPFIANPDLVERLRTGAPLAQLDPKTLYGGGAEGYIDYPAFDQALAAD